MAKKGLRKSATERQAKEKAKKETTDKLLIGAAAVTTASAMVAAIYAACRALDKEKKAAESAKQEMEAEEITEAVSDIQEN